MRSSKLRASLPAVDSSLIVDSPIGSTRNLVDSLEFLTKSLSGNQYLGEDELGAGEMNEAQVVLGLLFPTHQESPRAVQPRMCSLHYPTPGPPARVLASPLSLASLPLVGGRDVGLVASSL